MNESGDLVRFSFKPWALMAKKCEFYYSDKIFEVRIKQISRENGLLFSDPSYTCKGVIKLLSSHRSQKQPFFLRGGGGGGGGAFN